MVTQIEIASGDILNLVDDKKGRSASVRLKPIWKVIRSWPI